MIAGSPPELGYRRKRWSLEEYRRLVEIAPSESGIRIELIEGEIVETVGQNLPHITSIGLIAEALRSAFGSAYHVREERPVELGDSAPQPDVSVIQGRPIDYAFRHPRSDEIALLVEVSDTTTPYDRTQKASLYARNGIAEYWIADLNARYLIVHRGPLHEGGWSEVLTHGPDARVPPLSAPRTELLVAHLLPPLKAPKA